MFVDVDRFILPPFRELQISFRHFYNETPKNRLKKVHFVNILQSAIYYFTNQKSRSILVLLCVYGFLEFI